MSLERHRRDWEALAATDPLWAVLTDPARKGGRWTREEFLATGEAEIAEVLERAERLGRPSRRRRALDFGCGAGRLTRALALRFDEAVGVDIATGMVAAARELNADVPAARFEVNERPDLSRFETGAYDLVYTSLVLQHLPDQRAIEAMIAELLRLTAPRRAARVRAARRAGAAEPVAAQPSRLRAPARSARPGRDDSAPDAVHADADAPPACGAGRGARRVARRRAPGPRAAAGLAGLAPLLGRAREPVDRLVLPGAGRPGEPSRSQQPALAQLGRRARAPPARPRRSRPGRPGRRGRQRRRRPRAASPPARRRPDSRTPSPRAAAGRTPRTGSGRRAPPRAGRGRRARRAGRGRAARRRPAPFPRSR